MTDSAVLRSPTGAGKPGGPVTAVIFDLDDTLFPQSAWLAGAFDLVADEAERLGCDRRRLRDALDEAVAEGSDRGNTIDRALHAAGERGVDPAVLVRAFHSFVPSRIDPYPGVEAAVRSLAERVPLAIVTDGHPPGQRGKLAAIGLERYFSAVVCSDEMGREARKPNPAGMLLALEMLGRPAEEVAVIGDRPDKDIAAALAAGVRAVRVQTGEHRAQQDLPGTWASVGTVAEAVSIVAACVAQGHAPNPVAPQPGES